VAELAREAGIEPGVLDILKRYGLISMTELMARQNIADLLSTLAPDEQGKRGVGGQAGAAKPGDAPVR
jgi:hypothetical protein